ncbi:MAG: amidohydrolase family protein [Flavobacteriales bacterium]|nr:amidohydrolase family protein [Flavobacteriales bacterium]MBL6872627.1 amidohydrolase family protein [Flavobacteriales bacterium]
MRYLTSDIVFTSIGPPILNGVLVVDDSGKIVDILSDKEGLDSSSIEYFEGALCPGFINTHCHLELSHLKDRMKEKTGLPYFISNIGKIRKSSDDEIQSSIKYADKLMFDNGIVAVGDISNTADSFAIKDESPIYYHSFIELFASDPSRADEVFQNGLHLLGQCKHKASLTPHANYSASKQLFEKIRSHNSGEIITIHNQETPTEDQMFIEGSGELLNELIARHFFKFTGKTALKSTLTQLPDAPVLMVHNTFTTKEDIHWVSKNFDNVFWATCPKANIYIEDALPTYDFFIEKKAKMTYGTDSLASNDTLSILEEMKTIKSSVSLDKSIEWACKNGAEFLQIDECFGTFEKGKSPGINHLKNLENFELTDQSSVSRLI